MHGRDDAVIHHSQLDVIARALPPAVDQRHYRTGTYSHAGERRGGVRTALGELATTLGMIRALHAAGRQR